MSKLSNHLKSQDADANPAISANPNNSQREISNSSNNSSEDIDVSLSPAQQIARADVLAQLASNPAVQHAFVNRFEQDGTMIVTLAIRGVGTGELKIPAARFSIASLDDHAALLGCMQGAA